MAENQECSPECIMNAVYCRSISDDQSEFKNNERKDFKADYSTGRQIKCP